MPSRQQVRDALRAIDRRAPQRARASARSVAKRMLRRPTGPLVTVVITSEDQDSDVLDEALESVVTQSHVTLEILVVPYGSDQQIASKMQERIPGDYRLSVLPLEHDRSHAREAGARAAHGAYLCFLDGQDTLPQHAIANGVESLERSGSDFAFGRVETRVMLAPSVLAPYDPVHRAPLSSVSVRRFPQAITDTAVGNRLFRTDFWRQAGLSFILAASDTDLAMTAFERSESFDVLAAPTYGNMNRAHGKPVEHLEDHTLVLDEWVQEQRQTAERLAPIPFVRAYWAAGLANTGLPRFIANIERLSPEQWVTLRDLARELDSMMTDEQRQWVRTESRVKAALLAADHREELTDFVEARWFERDNVPTQIIDGAIYAELPFFDDTDLGVPREAYRLGKDETPARVELRTFRTPARDRFEIDLVARIELVDLADSPPVITARVVHELGASIDVPVTPRFDELANQHTGHMYQDYRPGGCTLDIDLVGLHEGAWSLEITVDIAGVSRTTTAIDVDTRGPLGALGTPQFSRQATSVETNVRLRRGRGKQFLIDVEGGSPVVLESATVSGRTVELALAGEAERLRVWRGKEQVSVDVVDGTARFALPEVSDGRDRPWAVRAYVGGEQTPISWRNVGGEPWLCAGERVVLGRTARGMVEIVESAGTVVLDRVELAEPEIVVHGHWLGAPSSAELTLRGPRNEQSVSVPQTADFSVSFSTRMNEWGLRETGIVHGEHLLGLSLDDGAREGTVIASTAYISDAQRFQRGDNIRIRALHNGRGDGIGVAGPTPIECSGAYAQRRLREACVAGLGPVDPTKVYFSVYAGGGATDAELAIFEELRATRPDLTLYWGVVSEASWVPEGAHRVYFYTPEWYEVLSTAGYLVQNIDFDRWWRKRPGQKFLQTFHGYPAKSMGIRMWKAKGFTPRRIEAEVRRTTASCDLILTPIPEMDVHYRTEYAYEGEIHSDGYPRDDALLLPSAADVRERTRRLLGLTSEKKVILYAPTWRDHLALNYRSARLVEHLDVIGASERLGPDYVILLRGHRFNSVGSERKERTAQVIDVTDYPEINDLILASDAAVLDYSSLRFDYTLTGRPMVFLVPDLADYTGGIRGFLFDYAESSPGPLLSTADEVVAALGDLDGLQAAYADRIAEFNKAYHYTQDGKATARVVSRFFDAAAGQS